MNRSAQSPSPTRSAYSSAAGRHERSAATRVTQPHALLRAPPAGPGSGFAAVGTGTSLALTAAVKQVARQSLRDSRATVRGSSPTAQPRHPIRRAAFAAGTRSCRNPARRGKIRLSERRGRDFEPPTDPEARNGFRDLLTSHADQHGQRDGPACVCGSGSGNRCSIH